MDLNCDNVDGAVDSAVFLSSSVGNDANSGSKDKPYKTLSVAYSAASSTGKSLYIAKITVNNTTRSTILKLFCHNK